MALQEAKGSLAAAGAERGWLQQQVAEEAARRQVLVDELARARGAAVELRAEVERGTPSHPSTSPHPQPHALAHPPNTLLPPSSHLPLTLLTHTHTQLLIAVQVEGHASRAAAREAEDRAQRAKGRAEALRLKGALDEVRGNLPTSTTLLLPPFRRD